MTYLNGSETMMAFVYDEKNHRPMDVFDDGSVIQYVNKIYPYAEVIKNGFFDYSVFVYYDPYTFNNTIAVTKWGAERWAKKALLIDKPPAKRPQTYRPARPKKQYTIRRGD